jgi:hypothetical protein
MLRQFNAFALAAEISVDGMGKIYHASRLSSPHQMWRKRRELRKPCLALGDDEEAPVTHIMLTERRLKLAFAKWPRSRSE